MPWVAPCCLWVHTACWPTRGTACVCVLVSVPYNSASLRHPYRLWDHQAVWLPYTCARMYHHHHHHCTVFNNLDLRLRVVTHSHDSPPTRCCTVLQYIAAALIAASVPLKDAPLPSLVSNLWCARCAVSLACHTDNTNSPTHTHSATHRSARHHMMVCPCVCSLSCPTVTLMSPR